MADLIYRDALMEDLRSECPESDVCISHISCIECIVNRQPAVNRWIPCSERLPERNEVVLYVWRSKNGNVAVLHGWHIDNCVENAWHQSGVGMCRPNEEVTHWMPLPDPPQEVLTNGSEET